MDDRLKRALQIAAGVAVSNFIAWYFIILPLFDRDKKQIEE